LGIKWCQFGGDMENNDPLALTVVETAALLRVSRNTAYSLISQGKIPAVRFGKRILVPKRALMALLDSPTVPSDG